MGSYLIVYNAQHHRQMSTMGDLEATGDTIIRSIYKKSSSGMINIHLKEWD